jgi:peptidoglycan-associated lipoprotein
MNSMQHTLLAVVAAAVLAGCSSTKLDADVPVESRTTPSAAAPSAGTRPGGSTAGAAQSQVAPVDLTKTDTAAASSLPRIIYFDFDSFVVKDEFRGVVETNAKAMSTNKAMRLSIEGHADERGGREYNLALGQKRAEAVARSLALLGASPSQMEAVSFGEERPAVQGSDEAAWAKNRRVELVSRR